MLFSGKKVNSASALMNYLSLVRSVQSVSLQLAFALATGEIHTHRDSHSHIIELELAKIGA